MTSPLYVRPLSSHERQVLEAARRSSLGFTVRRSQILLASASGQTTSKIASLVGCTRETVRLVLRDFEQRGLDCLDPQPSGPRHPQPTFSPAKREQLLALLHRNPRELGFPRSTWTLATLAQACQQQGITASTMSLETIRQTLKAAGVNWKRAKNWITSPDPEYERKKRQRDRLILMASHQPEWVVGFLDEVWWSRLAQPHLHSWTDESAYALEEKQRDKEDPEPKAMACYGIWCPALVLMLLRFVCGRPVSNLTCQYLDWAKQEVQKLGKKVLVLIWDNATWHRSKLVRHWIGKENIKAKREGGVRLIICFLPVKSPWLNAIEPKWVHAKRAIVEPIKVLSTQEMKVRICEYFGCELLEPLAKQTA